MLVSESYKISIELFYEQLLVNYNIECEIGRKGSFGDLL